MGLGICYNVSSLEDNGDESHGRKGSNNYLQEIQEEISNTLPETNIAPENYWLEDDP